MHKTQCIILKRFDAMYQHKIHIYSLQYTKNGEKRKVVQIEVISAYAMSFFSLQ